MHRIRNAIKGDLLFQWKYGFYLLYLVLTIFYIVILQMLPEAFRQVTGTILVYSDPAAMGLFFMGAIVLLEKSQRVLNSIAVSPLSSMAYLLSKVISIGVVSVAAGVAILLGAGTKSLFLPVVGIFSGSVLFSLLGLYVGCTISSLTQYIVKTIPVEIIGFVLPVIRALGYFDKQTLLLLHPGCAAQALIAGEGENAIISLLSCMIWILILGWFVHGRITKMFQTVGGVKL